MRQESRTRKGSGSLEACVLFDLEYERISMAIDKTLTNEQAVRALGDLLPYTDLLDRKCRDSTVHYEYNNDLYDETFTFNKHSQPVLLLQEWRRCQREFGFFADETYRAHRSFSHALKIVGIYSSSSCYEEESNIPALFCENLNSLQDHQAVYETLINAFEHSA